MRFSRISSMALAAIVGTIVAQPAYAADQLAATTLTFTASGSPNTLSGTWTAPALDIQINQSVTYFGLEILSVTSAFGVPDSFTFTSSFPFDSRGIAFGLLCPVGIQCVGLPGTGSVSIVNVATTSQWMALDFLFRLDPDNPRYTASGPAIVTFGAGGPFATAEGAIRITAYGTSAPIPEPSSSLLLALGTIFILFAMRRRAVAR